MRLLEVILKKLGNVRLLRDAKQIQAQMLITGLHQDGFGLCTTKLVSVFLMQGSLEDARLVLDKIPISIRSSSNSNSNAWAWNAVMRGYAEEGLWQEALAIFKQMQRQGIKPDKSSIPSVLKTCASLRWLQQGREIHGYVVANGFFFFDADVFIGNALVYMYAKCGLTDVARHVFDNMPQRNVVSWNSMLAGYTHNGEADKALQLFQQMGFEWEPDSITVVALLSSCINLRAIRMGKEIQGYTIRTHLVSDVFVGNALVDMYAKCGRLGLALRVFDRMYQRNRVSWNTMIGAYVQYGYSDEAMQFFREMELAFIRPDSVSISCLLPAFGLLADLQHGQEIHGYTIKSGLDRNVVVGNALIHMYATCQAPELACQVFDKMPYKDVVSWNAIIAGFAQNGQYDESLQLFGGMILLGMKPNSVTFASVLPACASLGTLNQGKAIHNYLLRSEHGFEIFVTNALIDVYVKCGSIEDACQLFENMPQRDVVSWNVIIGCALIRRNCSKSWNFCQMRLDGVKPDSVTITNVLSGCARAGALKQGKGVHCYLIIDGFESHVSVGNALIDMYAKCGNVEAAHQVFNIMPQKNVISWNTMIGGYGMHGFGEAALRLFYEMQHNNVKLDYITFISVLSACGHAGLAKQGLEIFYCMSQQYHIAPTVEHYACIVDLLGRAGQLDDAQHIIDKMPVEPDASVWGALLGACRIYCNIELGKCAAGHLFELEPENTGNYALLANIYAAAGNWDCATEIRTIMKSKGLKKSPGRSWIEVKNKVHIFLVGDQCHPQSKEIYAALKRLTVQMQAAGYTPDTNFVLFNVEIEDKDHNLLVHSEKLAIVFGLMNTSCGTPIRISKNLRVCGDCHNATKFISRIVSREIIVRDAHRFHYFKDGFCSCGDYW